MASSGLVLRPRPSGMPADRRRARSLSHLPGMNTSKSAQACPEVVTYAENTVVTQFSTCPVHPACCGATHAVASPSFSCAVSSIAIPGPIRSSSSHGSQACARPGSSARSSRQSQRYEPSRACIRYGDSCPAASARAQQFAFTPGDSPSTYANAIPALRRCARTRPRTALTCASTLSAHPDTSPMLASAAVSSLSIVTHQATRHGRPGFHPCNSGTPLTVTTQRDPSPGHPAPRSIRIVSFCETATVIQVGGTARLGPLPDFLGPGIEGSLIQKQGPEDTFVFGRYLLPADRRTFVLLLKSSLRFLFPPHQFH